MNSRMSRIVKAIKTGARGIRRVMKFVRVFLFFGLFIYTVYFTWTFFFPSSTPIPKSHVVLRLFPPVAEKPVASSRFASFFRADEQTLWDVLGGLGIAASDERVVGLLLDLSYTSSLPYGVSSELVKAIEKFSRKGKWVTAFSNNGYTQSSYYLASVADQILLDPFDSVSFRGFSYYKYFYKKALDRFGLEPFVIRAGDHKDAVSSFLFSSMSQAERRENERLLSGLWDFYLRDIAQRRDLEKDVLTDQIAHYDQLLEQNKGSEAAIAKNKMGLVDSVVRSEALANILSWRDPNYREMDFFQYVAAAKRGHKGHKADPFLAVIVVDGEIISGRSLRNQWTGSFDVVDLIQRAESDGAAGILLRLNTPGGSAKGSEEIRRALVKLSIPVYVSMGTLAASGGYWIATSADKIWALPGTITGSIGVWAIAGWGFQKFLQEWGVSIDGVGTTWQSEWDPRLGLPPSRRIEGLAQSMVDRTYDRFLNLVARSRSIDRGKLLSLADGRVWSGEEAKRHGLVDRLGGFYEALKSLKYETEIPQANWRVYRFRDKSFNEVVQKIDKFLRPIDKVLRQKRAANPSQKLLERFHDPYDQYLLYEGPGVKGISQEVLSNLLQAGLDEIGTDHLSCSGRP